MLKAGGFDAVIIVTPDQIHREQAIMALELMTFEGKEKLINGLKELKKSNTTLTPEIGII